MNNQVSFREVQVYAQKHNIDFNTAAKELGLTEAQARELASGMTGDANWGKVMDEVTFNPEKADEYKAAAERMAEAEKKPAETLNQSRIHTYSQMQNKTITNNGQNTKNVPINTAGNSGMLSEMVMSVVQQEPWAELQRAGTIMTMSKTRQYRKPAPFQK